MSTIYERIESLCKQKGITGGKMCNDLGYSRNTMSALKNGRSTTLKLEKAQRIADYFGVSINYLMGTENDPTGEADVLDEVDVAFYGDYKELDESEKEVLRDMVRVMRERRAKRQE